MEKPTTSALRQIVAELRQPLLTISAAANTAANVLDKLEAALNCLESQELDKAVSLLPNPTSLSDSSSDSEASSSSPASGSATSAASNTGPAPPLAERKEGPSSPTLPTMIDLSLAVDGQESPTSASSPTLSPVSLARLDQDPPTSPTLPDLSSGGLDRSSPTSAKSFVWRTSPLGSPFTMTEALPRIFWRPALPTQPEAPPLDLTAPLSSPTFSASPTKSATPNQSTPTSPPNEPPQRLELICSIPLNVKAPGSASVPATTRSPPNVANSQTISLPYGWEKRIVSRPKGKDKGRVDVYLRPPNGIQLRSKTALREYFEKHPEVLHDASVTNFNKHDVPEVNEVIDGAAPDLERVNFLRRMPARSISRSVPNTSSTDVYEESTF